MHANRTSRFAFLAAALVSSCATAQVPADLEDKLKAIGRVINPPATAALYAPRALEAEPYARVTVERDIVYGPDARNLLDVFSAGDAATGPRPVLVFVHGGAFVAGNRRLAATSPFYDNVMLWAVRNGMTGVNISYRLAPQNPWPAGPVDVGSALRWVHEQIAARGGDPRQVYLLGHSAGATHVAAYVAHPAFHKVPGAGIAGALLLSGIYRVTPELVAGNATYPGYYGTDPTQYPERSSVAGLIATTVPLWVGTAELDPPSFEQQALDLKDALCAAGKCPAFARFAGHGHMSEAYSIHTADQSVGNAMRGFVRAHAAAAPAP